MASQETESRFVDLISEWLIGLPHDLKILFDVLDDENLTRQAREIAAGAIIYVVSPNDVVADRHDSFMSYCDDAILLRMALARATAGGDEDTEFFKSRFPQFFDDLDEELTVCKEVMGEVYTWLEGKVDALSKQEYKGKKIAVYLDREEDAELLFEDGLAFRTEYPVEEDMLGDRLKKASTILEVIQRRMAEESRT